jgi:hypothetical protein
MRLQHDLSGFDRVSFRDVHQKVNMVQSETKVTELKPEAFEFMERLDTSVDVRLFSETSIPVMGDKNHRHPIVTGVTRNLFRATATYNIHIFFDLLSRP